MSQSSGAAELTGPPRGACVDWVVRGGDGLELTENWRWRPRRRGQSALEGERGSRPASQLQQRESQATGSRVEEGGMRVQFFVFTAAILRASSTAVPSPCTAAWDLEPGTRGRDEGGGKSGARDRGGPGAGRGARYLSLYLLSRRLFAWYRGP